ncbi:MAG: hypothetical protein Q9160_000472 [Pyrenula sp. 1 TL-2023]
MSLGQGSDVLQNAQFNKGTSFTEDERETFGLHGLLPPNVQTLEEQVQRAYDQYSSRQNALAKNTFATSMYEQNQVLYFKARPLWEISLNRFVVEADLKKFGSKDDVDYIVVSDGEEVRNELAPASIRTDNYRLSLMQERMNDIACFNDDIQGTGAVTLAGIMAGIHISKLKLSDIRMVVFGSGSAGTGIAEQVRDAIAAETRKPKEEAAKQIWCVDKPGLLIQSHGDNLTFAQRPFARADSEWQQQRGSSDTSLLSVIKAVKPHVLIGTSTKPKAFTREIIQEMASHVDRPIIFPLSNPTRLHEADPKDIYEWTDGRALIATGSPFPPVTHNGKQYEVAECNNSTCFPGIGLGVVLSRARRLSDRMLVAAVKALAGQSPVVVHEDPDRGLLPGVEDVREISVRIAVSVVREAEREGLATVEGIPKQEDEEKDLEEWVRAQMWEARYRELVRA